MYYDDLRLRCASLPVDGRDGRIDGAALVALCADVWVNPASGGLVLSQTQYAMRQGVRRETVSRQLRRGDLQRAGVHVIGAHNARVLITNVNSLSAQFDRLETMAATRQVEARFTNVCGGALAK
jgi:hypothetical protein